MEDADISVTFGADDSDRTTLSKSSRLTLEALYQHPLAHNLEWSEVVALFAKIGAVDDKGHNEIAFSIDGESHRIRKPHSKDLTAADVMSFRHMLSRSGWAPHVSSKADTGAPAQGEMATVPEPPDLLVVVEHRKARVFHLDVRSDDTADHVIRPYDPHHFLHHLAHKDQSRERGQRSPEDHSFYERVAEALSPARSIVLIGHGKGHSNAADHLAAYLRKHHAETFHKVVRETAADLSSVTAPQLLDLARRALTIGTPWMSA